MAEMGHGGLCVEKNECKLDLTFISFKFQPIVSSVPLRNKPKQAAKAYWFGIS